MRTAGIEEGERKPNQSDNSEFTSIAFSWFLTMVLPLENDEACACISQPLHATTVERTAFLHPKIQ